MADASSLRRGLSLLMAVGRDDAAGAGGHGVTRLAEHLGMDKGQVSRMLRVLADTGLVERDPDTRGYRLGWEVFAMAARAGDQRLLDLTPPILLQLCDRLGERSHLSVLRGTQVLTVLTESPDRAVQAVGWVGRSVPVHTTSSGRALLFDHDLAALAQLLDGVVFAPLDPAHPGDPASLHRGISAARRQGVAVVDEEFEAGLVGVAAPVRDARGRIVACLNVSAPTHRLAGRLPEVGHTVRSAAEALSQQLGRAPTRSV